MLDAMASGPGSPISDGLGRCPSPSSREWPWFSGCAASRIMKFARDGSQGNSWPSPKSGNLARLADTTDTTDTTTLEAASTLCGRRPGKCAATTTCTRRIAGLLSAQTEHKACIQLPLAAVAQAVGGRGDRGCSPPRWRPSGAPTWPTGCEPWASARHRCAHHPPPHNKQRPRWPTCRSASRPPSGQRVGPPNHSGHPCRPQAASEVPEAYLPGILPVHVTHVDT